MTFDRLNGRLGKFQIKTGLEMLVIRVTWTKPEQTTKPAALFKKKKTFISDLFHYLLTPSCRLHQSILCFLKHCGWAGATPTCSHTHLEISQLGQPPSAKPSPTSSTAKPSSPVRSNKHLSATPEHLELIKPRAPPRNILHQHQNTLKLARHR